MRTRSVVVPAFGVALVVAVVALAAWGATAPALGVTVAAVGLYGLSRTRGDMVTAISGLLLVPMLVPAQLRLAPLGAAGTPAALAGVAALLVWGYGFAFARPWLHRSSQPARWGIALVAVSVLASYISLGFRAPDVLEGSGADRGVLTLMSMAGVLLLVADGIADRSALRRVLSAVVAGGGVVAGFGILQFATGVDIASRVRLPGFTYIPAEYDPSRSGFNRIVSTTSHPIELSVVLVLLLPLALHIAFTSAPRERLRWWLCTVAIGIATPMTVSRTAVVALAVAAVVLVPAWTRAQRKFVAYLTIAGLMGMKVVIPGLIGSLRALLFDPGEDPSLSSRQVARDYAVGFLLDRPVFGRGFGTFVPVRYEFLDNQILMTLVETGLFGLLALLCIPLVASWQIGRVRRLAIDPDDRGLAQAFLACILVGHATWLTFDALSFATSRSLVLISAGCAAALWRIVRDEVDPHAARGRTDPQTTGYQGPPRRTAGPGVRVSTVTAWRPSGRRW